jgi:hypothetical protein
MKPQYTQNYVSTFDVGVKTIALVNQRGDRDEAGRFYADALNRLVGSPHHPTVDVNGDSERDWQWWLCTPGAVLNIAYIPVFNLVFLSRG